MPTKVLQHLPLGTIPIISPLPCCCVNPQQLQSPQLRSGLYSGLISCDLILVKDSLCCELLRAVKSHPIVLEIICGPHRSCLDKDVYEVHKLVYVGTCMEVRLISSEMLKPHLKINDFSLLKSYVVLHISWPWDSRKNHTEERQFGR